MSQVHIVIVCCSDRPPVPTGLLTSQQARYVRLHDNTPATDIMESLILWHDASRLHIGYICKYTPGVAMGKLAPE